MKKQNDEITIQGLIDIFLPKLWLVAIVAVVFAALFGGFSFIQKDTYTSTGKYMVSKINYSNENMSTGLTESEIAAMQGMIANAKEIINTNNFANEIIDQLGKYEYVVVNKTIAENELGMDFQSDLAAITSIDSEAAQGLISAADAAGYSKDDVIKSVVDSAEYKTEIESAADDNGNSWICNIAKEPIATDDISAKDIRGMMSVSLSSDDTTCYYFKVTSEDPVLATRIAEIAGEHLVEIYQNTKYAIEIIRIDDPTVPDAPNSKNVTRNAVIGFAGGMLIALLVVFVLSRFDVIIHSRERLEDAFDLPILGVIPRLEVNNDNK